MNGGASPTEHTSDGRFIIVSGRRWRATDPGIPEGLRVELVAELMSARRAVKNNSGSARPRVQDAKVALGERGDPWWEQSDTGRDVRIAATIRTLLRHRDADKTICPSDAARVVGGDDWRPLMERARSVVTDLYDDGTVRVLQGGKDVDPRTAHGPIRVARGTRWTNT